MTDARTEARRRLATAMRYRSARSNFPGDALEWWTVEDLADAVLELIPDVNWGQIAVPAIELALEAAKIAAVEPDFCE